MAKSVFGAIEFVLNIINMKGRNYNYIKYRKRFKPN